MKIRYKRKDKLRPTRKKIPNLLDKVREHVVFLRDHGYEEAKKNKRFFSSVITKEQLSRHFGVQQGEISHCLHLLNLEGLVSQPKHVFYDDGWGPDKYYIIDCVRVKDDEKEIEPLFSYHKCPICDSELLDSTRTYSYNKFCPNKCFTHYLEKEGNVVQIFNEEIYFKESLSKGISSQATNKMNKTINYWKKNYRYLIKILEENN